MQADDALLFKFRDGDHSRAWRCPLTAFHDPSFQDAKVRESIEARSVAFWDFSEGVVLGEGHRRQLVPDRADRLQTPRRLKEADPRAEAKEIRALPLSSCGTKSCQPML